MEKSILVVDDISKNLQLVGNLLKKEGYKVFMAQSGKVVLQNIGKVNYDLILLDVMMPEMDGFEVCQKLKENEKTKNIPIIFLTARNELESITRGFELGGVDYVTKPFNGRELLSRVKTHLTIHDQKNKLIELNATKDKFFSIIAHDLKGPLGGLSSLAELLYTEYEIFDEEKRKMFVKLLYGSTKTIFELLQNLLTWATSQRNKLPFQPQKVLVDEIISENLSLLENYAREKEINIISNYEKGTSIFADKNMILSVMRNLLSNAIKFTPQKGTIIIDCKKQDTTVLLSVLDTGIGIPAKNIYKLFRIDEHYSTPGTEDEKGTGLGLILCKEFVEKNGGEIKVESEKGKGSLFSFTVPTQNN